MGNGMMGGGMGIWMLLNMVFRILVIVGILLLVVWGVKKVMEGNRFLIIATVLIITGATGIFSMTWFGGLLPFSGGMARMMMGSGMTDQDKRKEMMQEMMSGRLPPGLPPEDLPDPDSPGAKLLNRYCTQCHNLPSPLMKTAEEWPSVEARMINRMEMMSGTKGMMKGMMGRGMMDMQAPSAEEEKELLAYLQRNALRPASVETLGPPDTPGLALFQKACSQCHALPDPGLHTADEWPGVVERMQKNMEIMGKPVITDEERDKIAGYLNQYNR